MEDPDKAKKCCGAKTRSGEPCKKPPMKNGRCRMHGGKSMPGNTNAKTHGIYQKFLAPEEQEEWSNIELGKVDDELRLCRIRLQRALRAEIEANGEVELEAVTEAPAVMSGVPMDETIRTKQYRRKDYQGIINTLLGRIESLEKTRKDLMADMGNGNGIIVINNALPLD